MAGASPIFEIEKHGLKIRNLRFSKPPKQILKIDFVDFRPLKFSKARFADHMGVGPRDFSKRLPVEECFASYLFLQTISIKHCAQHKANVEFSIKMGSPHAPNHENLDFRNFRNLGFDRRTLSGWGFADIEDRDIWFENSKSTHFKVPKTNSKSRFRCF